MLYAIFSTHQCGVWYFKLCFGNKPPFLYYIFKFSPFFLSICYKEKSVGVSVIQDQARTSRDLLHQCLSELYHVWVWCGVRDLG